MKNVKLLEFGNSLYSILLWIKQAKEVHPTTKKECVLFKKNQSHTAVESGKLREAQTPMELLLQEYCVLNTSCSLFQLSGPKIANCLLDLKKLDITASETSDQKEYLKN